MPENKPKSDRTQEYFYNYYVRFISWLATLKRDEPLNVQYINDESLSEILHVFYENVLGFPKLKKDPSDIVKTEKEYRNFKASFNIGGTNKNIRFDVSNKILFVTEHREKVYLVSESMQSIYEKCQTINCANIDLCLEEGRKKFLPEHVE